jgi:hypothetical protein
MATHQQILHNATSADLVSAGNVAFHQISIKNIKLEAELKGLRHVD